MLTSELDAPWHLIPCSTLKATDVEQIGEAWFRYAWALDLADTGLLAQSFTDDVEAELMPMGRMRGHHLLVSTLKAFRAPWPWMQHYGRPLEIDIARDGTRASMLLGRIIPAKVATDTGEPLYGAHYKINLLKHADHGWRIQTISYHPGWFTHG